MAGFDLSLVQRAVAAAGGARLVAAGGITTAADISQLDRLGADAQVGMALYSGRLSLGEAVAAVLDGGVEDRLWPTVVSDEHGVALGLVWSTRESLLAAVEQRRGIYWSRSRNELWIKGATSGATQELVRVDLDCDRDALRFTVRQAGSGFCHTGKRSCWPERFDLGTLERVIQLRQQTSDCSSGTARLFSDPSLLAAKLSEEAGELARADSPMNVVHEAADLLYFALVKARKVGVSLSDVIAELDLRSRRVSRRPMAAKPEEEH
jgi:phosphoribosyl-ATP pyrophosphohydrolase